MIDKYWSMYIDQKIAEYYYSHYCVRSKKYDIVISAICLLASASCIYTWYIWKQHPLIWAFFIGASQIIMVLKPLFPYGKRVSSSKYLLQDLGALLRDVDNTWGFDGSGISDDKFRRAICEYEKRYDEIENRFAPQDLFPQNNSIHEQAQKDAKKYFNNRFNLKMEGV